MDNLGKELNISTLMKIAFKPEYSNIFNKIKDIKTPIKNHILLSLLDGKWHAESEILRITRKQKAYIGAVTLSSMINTLNHQMGGNNYLEKKIVNGRIYYKISNNYIGLTKAAFTKFRFID
ncbi:MAG: hypothetical protein ACFFHV_01525 [Promethearchaeota archaeon]